MRSSRRRLIYASLAALLAAPLRAADDGDGLDFLEEERKVVTGSRMPRAASLAPASVYVVTGRALRESGAQTLWEGLRGVPGLDVISSRAGQGEVSIRGLNLPLSNRTLVLLDGKTILKGFYDFAVWESLPVSMDEIDRVEIVAGPASALYGPNALSGVVNIITKRPEEIGPAQVSFSAGERGFFTGSAMTGARRGPWTYKLDLGVRTYDGLSDSPREAARTGLAHGQVSRDLGEAGELQLTAGLSDHRSRFAAATLGAPVDDGRTGFGRADWTRRGTRARVFWNFGRTRFRQVTPETPLDYDTYDAELSQSFQPHEDHALVVGGQYRRNESKSTLYGNDRTHHQDLWGLFFEERWAARDDLFFELSGRLDRHPDTGARFSPRGSAVYTLAPGQTLRYSGATAFRNPTLADNYANLRQPSGAAAFTLRGRSDLRPERMVQHELAYAGRLTAATVRAAVFHYRMRDQLIFGAPVLVSAAPPEFDTPANNVGATRAWGGEAQVEAPLARGLTGLASYSYQDLKDSSDAQWLADTAPRHKAFARLTGRLRGWTASAGAHWTAATAFRSNAIIDVSVETARLPDYWLFEARLARRFSGAWSGLEAAVSAWNLADRRHRQLAGNLSGAHLGRRIVGTLSYRFE